MLKLVCTQHAPSSQPCLSPACPYNLGPPCPNNSNAGSNLTDTYTGSSYLKGDTFFDSHHKYAVLWEPGEYVRWYVDDLLLFEVGKEALARKVSVRAAQLTWLWQRLVVVL